MMQLIPAEERKNKRCHYCCTWLSVKYKIPVEELDRVYFGIKEGNVYCCNKCAALHYKGNKKSWIDYDKKNEVYIYYDKEGNLLHDGDTIVYADGREEKLYLTADGRLGTDATNRHWIETGRAAPCEYGIYPLEWEELQKIVKKEEN